MSGKHGGRLRVEVWEIELATRIAGSFRPGDEDLKSALWTRLIQIKAKPPASIQNWKSYLIQSLYNAAKNFIRQEDVQRRHRGAADSHETLELHWPFWREEMVATSKELDLKITLTKVWATLTPEMRELAWMLIEEEGNISALAARLKRSRKTVEYWIQKLRTKLKEEGLE